MAHDRELSETPLVSLEAGKLLGVRQVAKVSAGRTEGASRDRAGGAADSRAETSRLLSKIVEVKIVEVDATDGNRSFGAAASRAETSRLLSKIGPEVPVETADSRAKLSRLLSKIGAGEG